MSTTDPRLLTWLGSPWSRECDICGVVTTDPERTARHKAWHALVDVLIVAFSKPADDLAEAGRNDDEAANEPRCLDVFAVGGQDALQCERFAGHRGMHWANDPHYASGGIITEDQARRVQPPWLDRVNATAVVRYGGDGAGKGSTARLLPPLAGAGVQSGCESVQGASGPQKGVQSLADRIRRQGALGSIPGLLDRPAAAVSLNALNSLADCADALEAERDRLAAWKAEALPVLNAYNRLARDVVPAPILGRLWVDMLTEHVDAVTTERDRLAADIAIMRDADLTATDVQRKRAVVAEGDRDDARAELRSLRRAAQVTDASWREHVERADQAEATVARVRALLDEMVHCCDTPDDPCPGHDIVTVLDLRAALDDHQQHDERPVSGAGMGERE